MDEGGIQGGAADFPAAAAGALATPLAVDGGESFCADADGGGAAAAMAGTGLSTSSPRK